MSSFRKIKKKLRSNTNIPHPPTPNSREATMPKKLKQLTIGQSDFRNIIEDDRYYIDKTLIIKEILDNSADVLLIPRPRRFGKTLNLTTLRYFFETTYPNERIKRNNRKLFKGLKIEKEAEFTEHQGKYPVIFLSFKSIKQLNFSNTLESIKRLITEEFRKHKYLLESKYLEKEEKEDFNKIIKEEADTETYANSLKFLSKLLYQYHNKKIILLIDEYDTPIHTAYAENYYSEMISFMKSFLGDGLKDNSYLKKGIITGILRIARESIFSGLNNLGVYSILKSEYSTFFGLTESETKDILKYYNLEDKYSEISKWYNGYLFGNKVIYNPWSILNYINSKDKLLEPYWINTSSNDIIKELVINSTAEVHQKIEKLIKGESIEELLIENTVFEEIEKNETALWSFLVFSGYLKAKFKRKEHNKMVYDLSIPNMEVEYLYDIIISRWIEEKFNNTNLNNLLKALLKGDISEFEMYFNDFVISMLSYYDLGGDNSERVYQAFTLGLLVNLQGKYEIKSNRESGYGRYDIMIIPKDTSKKGVIIEFKKIVTAKQETKDTALDNALKQIEEKKYAQELRVRGVEDIIELGIVFDGKRVWVKE